MIKAIFIDIFEKQKKRLFPTGITKEKKTELSDILSHSYIYMYKAIVCTKN